MNRSVLLATVLAIIAVPFGATAVGAHSPDPVTTSGLFGQNQRLEFRWRTGDEPPSAIRSAVARAAADSNATRASKAAAFAYDSAGSNQIGYGLDATCGVNGIACYTRNAPTGFTMWLREQGHIFDWGSLKWCQSYSTPATGCYDAETIALDEFGHVQGLLHHSNYDDDRDYQDAVVQTVSRTKSRTGWDMHAFGRCDVATLQREYDVTDSGTRYSTCLDIDTTLTLATSQSSVAYDGTASLVATLKVAAVDAYDRLKGNLVSGRTVKLQRRPAGTTTWTTVSSMASGSSAGSYVYALRLRSDTEFRATFATSSVEGLNGDTSATIRVDVGACTVAPCPVAIPAAGS